MNILAGELYLQFFNWISARMRGVWTLRLGVYTEFRHKALYRSGVAWGMGHFGKIGKIKNKSYAFMLDMSNKSKSFAEEKKTPEAHHPRQQRVILQGAGFPGMQFWSILQGARFPGIQFWSFLQGARFPELQSWHISTIVNFPGLQSKHLFIIIYTYIITSSGNLIFSNLFDHF